MSALLSSAAWAQPASAAWALPASAAWALPASAAWALLASAAKGPALLAWLLFSALRWIAQHRRVSLAVESMIDIAEAYCAPVGVGLLGFC
jgi:hypothetical protein